MFENIRIRKGQPEHRLDRRAFVEEFKKKFFDPRFEPLAREIEQLAEQAWKNYEDHRKAPRTVKAGAGFADPNYDLSVEWIETAQKIKMAESDRQMGKAKILVINASPRNEHTCPGEESKSFRLVENAIQLIEKNQMTADLLDLSRLTSEYGKKIYPCKACVSTAMPLCHWPCSCYPNHSLDQTQDWMSEIYEKWVSAHGILIISPVHWYQTPSVFKLMMDRLVCADGGNPDPSSTQGKDPKKAKKIELDGWDFPKHLAGRAFAVVVHGDSEGVENIRRTLVDWLTDMDLIQAGASASFGGYIGYYEPYATSHDALDKDTAFLKEAENATLSLVRQVEIIRNGQFQLPDQNIEHVRKK